MNNTLQLKNSLISRIKDSKDLRFLKALQTIFDSSEQSLFELNDIQKESIQISRDEISIGDYKEHSQVTSDLRKWLAKK